MSHYFFLITFGMFSLSFGATSTFQITTVSSPSNCGEPALFTYGASPLWVVSTDSLLFVDVEQQNVHNYYYLNGSINTKHIDYGPVNAVSLIGGTNSLLVAVRAGVYTLDWNISGDAAISLLSIVDVDKPNNVINLAIPDADGRLWAATKDMRNDNGVRLDNGSLYSFEEACVTHPTLQLRPVSNFNGLTWSINQSEMYGTDSSSSKIFAFDFDSQFGQISWPRTFANVIDYGYEDSYPSGLTIDNQGNLWVALSSDTEGGTILQIDTTSRELLNSYKLSVSQPTALAWGGPLLDELFITTRQFNGEPLGGAIFNLQGTGYSGLAANSFILGNAAYYSQAGLFWKAVNAVSVSL